MATQLQMSVLKMDDCEQNKTELHRITTGAAAERNKISDLLTASKHLYTCLGPFVI